MLPYEGYNDGVTGVMRGALFGTGSLFKNTIEGSFGSIQAISGSVSKSLLLLSADREYLSMREE